MEELFTKFSGLGWIGTVLFMLTTGVVYFFPARRKELDEATAKLIKTLQETVGALERDLNIYKEKTLKLEAQQSENMLTIAAIRTENQTLRDFIDGRDKETTKFQNEALMLHRQNSDKLIDLLNILNQHFINMESVAINK